MPPTKLVVRFALIYWIGLVALVAALHFSGTESETAKNFFVYACAIYLAARGWPPEESPSNSRSALLSSLAGIAACDAVAQAAFVGYLIAVLEEPELWRSLPFAAATALLAQTVFAYFVLRSQLRQKASRAPAQS